MATNTTSCNGRITIIDIGGSRVADSIRPVLLEQLLKNRSGRLPFIPDTLMSSDVGLEIWSQLTYLPDYYQTREEIELLEHHGAGIAEYIVPGSSLIDLGSGDTRKIKPLLDRLKRRQCSITYYAVDLSHASLLRGLQQLASEHKAVQLVGLWGTFEDALAWCGHIASPRVLLSLGSVLGNDRWDDAVDGLSSWAAVLRDDDRMLIGIDSHSDEEKIWKSYHDAEGLFERFLRKGFAYSNLVLGYNWYRDEDWTIRGILENEPLVHRFVFEAIREVICEELGLRFEVGAKIECYEGIKYDPKMMRRQFELAGLHEEAFWKAPNTEIYEYLIARKL